MAFVKKWSEIPCREVFNARRENWNRENPSVIVRLECDDNVRYAAIRDLMLYRRPYPFNVEYSNPHLFVSSVQTITDRARYSSDAAQEVIDYTYKTYLDVTYSILPGLLYNASELELEEPNADQKGFLYAIDSIDPQVEFITHDYRHFYWKAEAELDEQGVLQEAECNKEDQLDRGSEGGFRLDKIVLSRSVEGYRGLPPFLINPGWEGRTNENFYTSDRLKFTFEPETLLFVDPKISYGPYNWEYPHLTVKVEANLIYREAGWNKFPKLVIKAGFDRGVPTTKIGVEFRGQCVMLKDGVEQLMPFEPFESVDMSDFLFSSTSHPSTIYDPNIFLTQSFIQ